MKNIIEMQELINGLPLEDALKIVQEALDKEPEDGALRLLKAEMLYRLNENEKDYRQLAEIIRLIVPFAEDDSFENLPEVLLMLVSCCFELDAYEDAKTYADKLHEIAPDNPAADYFAALARSLLGIEPEKALAHIDAYIEKGYFERGAGVKVDILLGQGRYDEAQALIAFAAAAHPESKDFWDDRMVSLLWEKGELGAADKLLDGILAGETTADYREHLLYRKLSLLYELHGKSARKEQTAYLKTYLERFPDDLFAYAAAGMTATSTAQKITDFERANAGHRCDRSLLTAYLERGTESDRDKYFRLLDDMIERGNVSREDAQDIVYGKFYPFDKGQAIRLLNKVIEDDPDYECAYTMLGKAYECGVGTAPDLKRAFELYEQAYLLGAEEDCGCGGLFYANAKYYGRGTEQDKKQAGTVILDLIKRRKEADRFCLYAVMAFEGDPRFDKTKARTSLNKYKTDIAAAFLLYKYAEAGADKEKLWQQFVKRYNAATALEQDYFKPYIENPEQDFVMFIRN